MDRLKEMLKEEINLEFKTNIEKFISLPSETTPIEKLKLLSQIISELSSKFYISKQDELSLLRNEIMVQAYKPLHAELYTLKSWMFCDVFLEAIELAKQGKISPNLLEVTKGVYAIQVVPVDFCQQVLSEISHFESWCVQNEIDINRPNSMNNYGVIMDEFGFKSLFNEMTSLIIPLADILYGNEFTHLTGHHAFVVEYELGKDLNLNFHYDSSQVTLNLCMGYQFTGGDLWFAGVRCMNHIQTVCTSEEYYQYKHQPGTGLLHLGNHRHGAKEVLSGKRSNLIVWFKDRDSEDSVMAAKSNGTYTCPKWCWMYKELNS